MKETIYLVCDASGVRKMSKRIPKTKTGQAIVKVLVGVDSRIFMPPPMATVELNVDMPSVALDRHTLVVQNEGVFSVPHKEQA